MMSLDPGISPSYKSKPKPRMYYSVMFFFSLTAILLSVYANEDMNHRFPLFSVVLILVALVNIIYGLMIIERRKEFESIYVEKGRYIEADFVLLSGWLLMIFGSIMILLVFSLFLYVTVI